MDESDTASACLRRMLPAAYANEIMQFVCERTYFNVQMRTAYNRTANPEIRRVLRLLRREWTTRIPRAACWLFVTATYAECAFHRLPPYTLPNLYEKKKDSDIDESAISIAIPSHTNADKCIQRSFHRQFGVFVDDESLSSSGAWVAINNAVMGWYWDNYAIYRDRIVTRIGVTCSQHDARDFVMFVETDTEHITVHSIESQDTYSDAWDEYPDETWVDDKPQLIMPGHSKDYVRAYANNDILWFYPTRE